MSHDRGRIRRDPAPAFPGGNRWNRPTDNWRAGAAASPRVGLYLDPRTPTDPCNMYLPDGPARPSNAELEAAWDAACQKWPELLAGPGYQVRWIGLDHDSTEQVLDLILAGDKTGTFTLPWIIERTFMLSA